MPAPPPAPGIASFDGYKWRNVDGTGEGTGPYLRDSNNDVLPYKNLISFNQESISTFFPLPVSVYFGKNIIRRSPPSYYHYNFTLRDKVMHMAYSLTNWASSSQHGTIDNDANYLAYDDPHDIWYAISSSLVGSYKIWSKNGLSGSWSERVNVSGESLVAAKCSSALNGRFLAVGTNGTVITSIDGVNFTTTTVSTNDIEDVVSDNTQLYITDGDTIKSTTDGINFTVKKTIDDVVFNSLSWSWATGLVAAGYKYYSTLNKLSKIVYNITDSEYWFEEDDLYDPGNGIDPRSIVCSSSGTSTGSITFMYGNKSFIKTSIIKPFQDNWVDAPVMFDNMILAGEDGTYERALFTDGEYTQGMWVNNKDSYEQLLIGQDGANILSYKEAKWKLWDGTGDGSGFYYNKKGKYTTQNSLVKLVEYDNGLTFISDNSIGYHKNEHFYNLFSEARPRLDLYSDTTIGSISSTLVNGTWQVYLSKDQRISSFDGNSWKWSDGTGSGTGPYNMEYINTLTGNAFSALGLGSYKDYLIVYGYSGRISSWNKDSGWKYWDGTGSGTGPWNSGDAMISQTIYDMEVVGDMLIFAGGSGNVCSYKDSLWVYADGTNFVNGSGMIYGVGVLDTDLSSVLYQRIKSIKWRPINNTLVVGGRYSNVGPTSYYPRVSSGGIDVNGDMAWKRGDGTDIGLPFSSWPYSSNVVTLTSGTSTFFPNSYPISCLTVMNDAKNTIVVAGGNTGNIGSFDGDNWKNSDGSDIGKGPFSVGENFNITQMPIINNKLIISGAQIPNWIFMDTIQYWDHDNIFRSISDISVGEYNNNYFFKDNKLYMVGLDNFILTINTQLELDTYIDKAIIPDATIKSNELNSVYCYKYNNGKYLMGVPGNSRGLYSNLDEGFSLDGDIECKWALLQDNNTGWVRHAITNDTWLRVSSGQDYINQYGYNGYISFSEEFSQDVVWKNPSGLNISNVYDDNTISGYGYSEVIINNNSNTDIYTIYSPELRPSPLDGVMIKSNTDTNINAYGKLTNGPGINTGNKLEFRSNFIGNVQAYISVGMIDGERDNVGTLLSDVGYYDPGWTPLFSDNSIAYRYNNRFYFINISSSLSNIIQEVDERLYKINTIHPLNLIDTISEEIRPGSLDYNGRTIYTSLETPAATKKVIASVFNGEFSNSVDVGNKLVAIENMTADYLELVGVGIPSTNVILDDYIIDTYFDNDYFVSTLSDSTEIIDNNKLDTLYIENEKLPLSLGSVYGFKTATSGNNTFILSPNYDGYKLGNTLSGDYTFFELFGQLYGYDELNIYLMPINNGTLGTPTKVAVATGLVYIATTPNEAYFLSEFDNSLYIFTGGRSLKKAKRMNRMSKIKNGIFSVIENTLFLDTLGDEIIVVRDSIVSTISKDEDISKIYNTTNGIIYKGQNNVYQYSYEPTGTVSPLVFQTGYYGTNNNSKSILGEYVVTIFNERKDDVTIKLIVRSFDEINYGENEKTFRLKPKDYDDNGYARIRIKPKHSKSLGTSLMVESNSKIILSNILATFKVAEKAVIAPSRSR